MQGPGFFIQASNGALIAILMWMLLFSLMYLRDQWERHRRRALDVYYVSKMAVAMTVFLLGFLIDRVSAAIWMKSIIPHNHYTVDMDSIPMVMLVGGAITAIVGGSCWIRVLSPERGPLYSWPVVMSSSLVFGCLIAIT